MSARSTAADKLTEIAERVENNTLSDISVSSSDDGFYLISGNKSKVMGRTRRYKDAKFIATANEDMTFLIDEINRTNRELAIQKWKTERIIESKNATIKKLRRINK